ncbi:glycosyltransferase family 2 protein [Capnocytophaga catalasegens]|uniref:Glycosyl transferase family 2 n=1 Tax=Capnocytophaga catalasegens TaxID=1004260 RepID=A0AAV5AV71_9FLAO|nr:glycosyltransferase family 2 protein [Capnocytophaga catalasegens]GIZ15342.1 glycosyl transferase family 2 [Capnocytophaga catalasegens]GJM50509.1 glycosyl transferase family 2 [Capnocytophaga catalasegens]GJM52113.1 glycosyl transferase family 2 [Capnocytophaga catalasegens]
MTIAVVILNWNGKALLEKFLPSVVQYSPEATIYIMDNASIDDSVSFVKEKFPNVIVIQNIKNDGYAKGYNTALQQIKADIYCLLNSDIEVTPDWLSPILHIFENQKDTAVIQPKILDYSNKKYFEYAGAAGGFIDKYGFAFCRGRIFYTIEPDEGQYDDSIPIFWASGACFFIRSEVFHLLGGFDEDFFAHQEEIDLCWRIHQMGKKILYTPETKVYHVGGATLSNQNSFKTYLNFRNGLFLLLKNLPKKQLFSVIFIRMLLDSLAGIFFLLQGKFSFTWSIIKAHIDFYKKISYFYKKRRNINQKPYFFTKSIILTYFFNNKKRFDNI